MPIYEYVCANCKQKFEQMRPMSEAAETGNCPTCGKPAPRALSLFCKSSEGASSSGNGSACGSCSASSCSPCSL